MKKTDWVLLTTMTLIGLGFYFIHGESISDKYGWETVAIPILFYLVFQQARIIDQLEKRVKALEYKPRQSDPRFDGLGVDYEL